MSGVNTDECPPLDWWYYTIELEPSVFTPGILPTHYSTPRHALSNIDVQGLRCLDVGTMEGLIPTLWAKNGARQVVAIDGMAHCMKKIDIVKQAHKVSYDYLLMPTDTNAYDFMEKVEFSFPHYNPPIPEGYREFDLINHSGVLYHVWSPLHWLASFRPLLREGGLMVVSTHFLDTDKPVMEFNTKGRLQMEPDTFWYISPTLFQYMLNMLGLKPIDYIGECSPPDKYHPMPYHYGSVVCRAVKAPVQRPDDPWIGLMGAASLELKAYLRKKTFSNPGFVAYRGAIVRDEPEIDLAHAVRTACPSITDVQKYNYTLKLSDKA